MPFSEKGNDAEELVDSLTMDGASLTATVGANLSALSPDFQSLTELSQELVLNTSDMETEEPQETVDTEMVVETQEEIEHEEEVQTEVGTEEVEVESEMEQERTQTTEAEVIKKQTIVPPLRPLTIAPKPTKVPITMKPIGGQQLLLLQGGSGGQAIKLVNQQGQEVLANFSLGRPVSLKPTIKTINSQTGNISIVQKPLVMKKIITTGTKTMAKPLTAIQSKQGQFMVLKSSDQPHSVKLIPGGNLTAVPSPTKTITLQQAQELGLISGAKLLPQGASTPKHTVVLNKTQQKAIKILNTAQGSTTTKMISLSSIKSPTKILPATSVGAAKQGQRIIFKTAGGGQTVLPPGQIIQLAGGQSINSGQLHQINIPGKGMQYIKFVSSAPTESGTTLKTSQAQTNHVMLSEIKATSSQTTGTAHTIAPKIKTATLKSTSGGQMIMVPSTYPITTQSNKIPIPMRHASHHNTISITTTPKSNIPTTPTNLIPPPEPTVDSNGMRPRKPCNCTKSQCLKLYCDCFANGEFCYLCNCMNCYNNLENEDHRQRAIKACLDRNPNAFRPKIGKSKNNTGGDTTIRKHFKGCNCKRSGCLKNYCECYEAKIACSSNCKCFGCRNIEDSMEKKNIRITSIIDSFSTSQMIGKLLPNNKDTVNLRQRRASSSGKQPINYITDDVIEATCQILLTSADQDDREEDEETTKKNILEEFGRCLVEIIDCSSRRGLN